MCVCVPAFARPPRVWFKDWSSSKFTPFPSSHSFGRWLNLTKRLSQRKLRYVVKQMTVLGVTRRKRQNLQTVQKSVENQKALRITYPSHIASRLQRHQRHRPQQPLSVGQVIILLVSFTLYTMSPTLLATCTTAFPRLYSARLSVSSSTPPSPPQ